MKIQKEVSKWNEYDEYVYFYWVDEKGIRVFGMQVSLSRAKNEYEVWSEWKLNWSALGSVSLEEAENYVALMNTALKYAKTN